MRELAFNDLHLVVRRMPKDVQDALRDNPGYLFVGGGFIRAVIGNEDVSDIDFFGKNRSVLQSAASRFTSSQFRDTARKLETKNAITLVQPGKTTLQFITRWLFSRAEDLVASFDFTVCQAAIWFEDGRFRSLVSDDFYPDLAAKRLVYTAPERDEEAGGSMLRVIKYVKRGYRIQMPDLAAVMYRVVAKYEPERGVIDMERFIQARMQEVDPLTVVDGLPVDEEVPVEGLDDVDQPR